MRKRRVSQRRNRLSSLRKNPASFRKNSSRIAQLQTRTLSVPVINHAEQDLKDRCDRGGKGGVYAEGGGIVKKLTRITFDPDVMGGKPCIRGLRVTVGTIVGLVAAGHSASDILKVHSLAFAALRG